MSDGFNFWMEQASVRRVLREVASEVESLFRGFDFSPEISDLITDEVTDRLVNRRVRIACDVRVETESVFDSSSSLFRDVVKKIWLSRL